jgi:hypothetical protein
MASQLTITPTIWPLSLKRESYFGKEMRTKGTIKLKVQSAHLIKCASLLNTILSSHCVPPDSIRLCWASKFYSVSKITTFSVTLQRSLLSYLCRLSAC